jgi:hypothetical protein
LVCIDSHTADALNRLTDHETAQTECCYGMAQDISSPRTSLISRKVVYGTELRHPSSFNHLVSAGQERVRNVDGERLGRPKVDGHFDLCRP